MGTITYSLPTAGQPNSTEDPKVATALQTLLTWANGNVDTNNIAAAAGITAAQMAAGAVRWQFVSTAVNVTAVDGQWINAGPGVTVTLPTATNGRMVVVNTFANVTGASPVVVAGSSIYGPGLNAATSFKLGTGSVAVVLEADGSEWQIIAGQQDTGWVSLTMSTNITQGHIFGSPDVQVKAVGNTGYVRGLCRNDTGGTLAGPAFIAPAASVPTFARPANPASLIGVFATSSGAIGTVCQFLVTSSGSLQVVANVPNTNIMDLSSIQYPLN